MTGKLLATSLFASSIESLSKEETDQLVQSLDDKEAKELEEYLERKWEFWGRESQLAPPGDWRVWLLLAGRGFGYDERKLFPERSALFTKCNRLGGVDAGALEREIVFPFAPGNRPDFAVLK